MSGRAIWPAAPARELCDQRGITEAQLKNRFGIHVKWNRRLFLTTETAERIADEALRVHPTALWGQAWWDAMNAMSFDDEHEQEELDLWQTAS